jgi:hypothetical protein
LLHICTQNEFLQCLCKTYSIKTNIFDDIYKIINTWMERCLVTWVSKLKCTSKVAINF